MRTPTTTRLAEKASGLLASRFSRRGFFARSAVVGSAIAANPITYTLQPTTAYAAVCNCSGSSCDCGALCCDGYTEFCCTLTGENKCPPGTLLGGWWKADGTAFCGGPRYYMDCNAPCGPCGCGGNGICGGECSGTGCGCAQGNCNNRKAGCTQFRYGQCNQGIPCIGPILCRLVTCIPPWAIEPNCSTTLRVDQNTAGHDRACLHKVTGSFESVSEVGGGLRVRGWALDFDVADPIEVHVYVDGTYAGKGRADRTRNDVAAAYPGLGPSHGFDVIVPASGVGTKNVCVYGINIGAGAGDNPLIGCRPLKLGNPFGSIDGVASEPGGVEVTGWVIDPDTTSPVAIHVYVDDAFEVAATANVSRPDVGARYPGFGNNHGFAVSVPVPPGDHTICVYAINQGAGTTNPLVGCRSVSIGKPFGSLDGARATAGGIDVSGWVIDPDTPDPIQVHLYVDGKWGGQVLADDPRPDVGDSYPDFGDAHGFRTVIPASAGRRQVCAYAINVGGGTNPLLACRTVDVVSGNPFGSLDNVSAGPGKVRVTGWLLDPDTTAPAKVHVYVDGTWGGEFVANTSRPDIGAAYPGYGSVHGFDMTLSVAPGFRQICVYGINVGAGSTNPLIACRSVFVGGAPFGSFDSATGGSGSIRVQGWAIDPDTANAISVHVYVNGAWAGQGIANKSRADVGAAYPLHGALHGFDLTVPAGSGRRNVCVYAINQAGNETNPLLACRDVNVS